MITYLIQSFLHIVGHSVLPFFVGKKIFPQYGYKASIIMLATILVDIDHLRAVPTFDPARCSIGFHTFHTVEFILVYCLMLLIPRWYIKAA